MHLGVPLLFVRAGELASADVAAERLLARVRADVSGEVVRAREGTHADATRERLLTRVDADVPGELVRAAEATVAVLHRTRVRPLMDGRFARPVGVLAWLHRYQLERDGALLVDL